MTAAQILAITLGLGNATSMFLAIRGIAAGWAVVIAAQSVFIAYALLTHQMLILVGGQPLCLLMGIYGLQRWLRKGVHRPPAGRAQHLSASATLSPRSSSPSPETR